MKKASKWRWSTCSFFAISYANYRDQRKKSRMTSTYCHCAKIDCTSLACATYKTMGSPRTHNNVIIRITIQNYHAEFPQPFWSFANRMPQIFQVVTSQDARAAVNGRINSRVPKTTVANALSIRFKKKIMHGRNRFTSHTHTKQNKTKKLTL